MCIRDRGRPVVDIAVFHLSGNPEQKNSYRAPVSYTHLDVYKRQRQRCAETIIAVMDRMFPENRGVEDHEQKLWDQLAIMSNFQLDIDLDVYKRQPPDSPYT